MMAHFASSSYNILFLHDETVYLMSYAVMLLN